MQKTSAKRTFHWVALRLLSEEHVPSWPVGAITGLIPPLRHTLARGAVPQPRGQAQLRHANVCTRRICWQVICVE